jgi:hypothetical protein
LMGGVKITGIICAVWVPTSSTGTPIGRAIHSASLTLFSRRLALVRTYSSTLGSVANVPVASRALENLSE